MDSFINRGVELQLVEDACVDLLESESFLRTIDFYGVEGIGKTSMLEKVVDICRKNNVRWIKANADQTIAGMSQEIVEQARKYSPQLPLIDKERDVLDQSVEIARSLLEQEPLAILLDAVDTANENQLEWLELLLSHLFVANKKLFVVLTSRRSILFENERSVARSLIAFPLQPLDRKSCESYLKNFGSPFTSEVSTLIYDWTRGYPLAMSVMIETIVNDGVDPAIESGRQVILAKIIDRVIYKGILANVEQDDLQWMQKALILLSVPRRFNLIMMQKLIETFEPELKLANSLAYMVLPRRIGNSTGALNWNLVKAGFAIDTPVRNIFLLQLRVEQYEKYCEINAFLANHNLESAQAVTGSDRIRYQQEYLYHIASSCADQRLREILEETVQQIIDEDETSPGLLFQFLQEFLSDQELKEVLGLHFDHVVSLIYKKLAREMYADAEQEVDEEKRVRYLRDFFYYTMHDPEEKKLSQVLKEQIGRLIQKEHLSVVQLLCKELVQDDRFKNVLKKHFPALFAQISGSVSTEG